jgi:hypothetical protein
LGWLVKTASPQFRSTLTVVGDEASLGQFRHAIYAPEIKPHGVQFRRLVHREANPFSHFRPQVPVIVSRGLRRGDSFRVFRPPQACHALQFRRQGLRVQQTATVHLRQRWSDIFGVTFEVLLYDLTSTCFECDVPDQQTDPRRFGYSRDKRPDCVQVIVARVVTPEGLPLAYELFPGHTADKTTLRGLLQLIQNDMATPRASG